MSRSMEVLIEIEVQEDPHKKVDIEVTLFVHTVPVVEIVHPRVIYTEYPR